MNPEEFSSIFYNITYSLQTTDLIRENLWLYDFKSILNYIETDDMRKRPNKIKITAYLDFQNDVLAEYRIKSTNKEVIKCNYTSQLIPFTTDSLQYFGNYSITLYPNYYEYIVVIPYAPSNSSHVFKSNLTYNLYFDCGLKIKINRNYLMEFSF